MIGLTKWQLMCGILRHFQAFRMAWLRAFPALKPSPRAPRAGNASRSALKSNNQRGTYDGQRTHEVFRF